MSCKEIKLCWNETISYFWTPSILTYSLRAFRNKFCFGSSYIRKIIIKTASLGEIPVSGNIYWAEIDVVPASLLSSLDESMWDQSMAASLINVGRSELDLCRRLDQLQNYPDLTRIHYIEYYFLFVLFPLLVPSDGPTDSTDREEGHGDGPYEDVCHCQGSYEVVRRLPDLSVQGKTGEL